MIVQWNVLQPMAKQRIPLWQNSMVWIYVFINGTVPSGTIGQQVADSLYYRELQSASKSEEVYCKIEELACTYLLNCDRFCLFHIPGEINPADILSKHWGHQQIWKQLQPLLFWKGDTRKLFEKKHCKEVYNSVS